MVSPLNLKKEHDNVLHYGTQNHFLSIIQSDAGANEYDDDELAFVKLTIKQPVFFTLDTNCFSLLKEFVTTLPEWINCLIDNDSGRIIDRASMIELTSFDEFLPPTVAKSA